MILDRGFDLRGERSARGAGWPTCLGQVLEVRGLSSPTLESRRMGPRSLSGESEPSAVRDIVAPERRQRIVVRSLAGAESVERVPQKVPRGRFDLGAEGVLGVTLDENPERAPTYREHHPVGR